ncbi:T9SS type A sorting domain-containing protein [Membranihabitans maritimus]|uniref:T9SS type A sorting domain-containing protein n=1 Tax=Membranihabitans maritimus TaxID=2904244 RepID=UPI001F3BD91D|nr:T9SS type A sorting domain-containing protein [Membranihabitans maritimus]
MRNLILILLAVLTITTVKAEDFPSIIINDGKSFVLDLKDWTKDAVQISILDPYGRTVYEENKEAGTSKLKKYNMDQLASGMYAVKVEDEIKEVTYNIYVNNQNVSIVGGKKVTYKPVVYYDNEGIISVNVLALNKNVSVNLSDSKGYNLYSDEVSKNVRYGKQLDISKLPSGYYDVTVGLGDQFYNTTIQK